MADASLQYLKYVLENNWDGSAASVDGRINDVPKPKIAIATDEDTKRLDPRKEDICFVREGGAQSITPRSVGWTLRKNETQVSIDFRTTESRERLEGTRDDQNVKEEYGGLRGEAERILDGVRKGDKEYDWVNGYEWRPLSEEMGFANWRGVWEVRLTELAENIEP